MSKDDRTPREKRWAFKRNAKRGFNLFLVLMILISSLPTSAFEPVPVLIV